MSWTLIILQTHVSLDDAADSTAWSRFSLDFGKINNTEHIRASPGKDPRSTTHDETTISTI
jgi:hypothetical protein